MQDISQTAHASTAKAGTQAEPTYSYERVTPSYPDHINKELNEKAQREGHRSNTDFFCEMRDTDIHVSVLVFQDAYVVLGGKLLQFCHRPPFQRLVLLYQRLRVMF